MGSVIERRKQIEQEVEERGEEFLNDCTATCAIQPYWKHFRWCGDQRFNTLYNKYWGKQGILHISAFTHLPRAERFVAHFYLQIAHGSWGAGVTSESYGFHSLQENPQLDNDLFFSAAEGTPDEFPYLHQRPLKVEEIYDVHAIFSRELRDFGGKTFIGRAIRSASPVWDREFIISSLDQLRDKALEMNGSDWERYEHRKQRVAEMHRDVRIA